MSINGNPSRWKNSRFGLDGNKPFSASFPAPEVPYPDGAAEISPSLSSSRYQGGAGISFETPGWNERFDRSQVFRERKFPEPSEEVLQRWEGVVETVDEDDGIFTARLYDLATDEPCPSETAELLTDDVSDDDRKLLQPGAVFYLTVGYSVRVSGRKDRFVRVEFRRLPNWTESDLHRAMERARRITRFLDPES